MPCYLCGDQPSEHIREPNGWPDVKQGIKMKKTVLATAAALGVIGATAASAAIYNYTTNISNGIGDVTVSIDTDALTATWTGANINLVMTDADFANWQPDLSTWGTTYTVDSISGTFTRYGTQYDAYWSSSPKHTQFRLGDSYSFLWMYGRDRWGRTLDFDGKGTSTTYTGSTTSTSGTPVSEPGILGLFGMALGLLAFGRFRRRKVAAA